MPLPSPKRNESQQKFVSRCMGNPQVKKDFADQKQRSAVCFSRFRRSKADFTIFELEALATALPEGNRGKKISTDISGRKKFKRKKDRFRKVRDEEVGSNVTGEHEEEKSKKSKKKKVKKEVKQPKY